MTGRVEREADVRSMEPEAEKNCEDLIAKALAILPSDPEVRISLASIRMSQQRFDEARQVILGLYQEIQSKEPCEFRSQRHLCIG